MKGKIIRLLLVSLFLLSGTVFAANWVYVAGDSNTDLYIDSDTVSKNGNSLIFWDLLIFDQSSSGGIKKIMTKYEAKLSSPRMWMQLAFHAYDSNNQENHNNQIVNSYEWDQIEAGSNSDKEIDVALSYAKEGQDASREPDINSVPQSTKEGQDAATLIRPHPLDWIRPSLYRIER